MNCVNHPETPVASYCQNCGKALCNECTRPVGGIIYCEQCLAAKVGAPGAQPGVPFPPGVPVSPSGANPALATILGVIPGVGAMYNGQFVKAMIHVLVFVILIAIPTNTIFSGSSSPPGCSIRFLTRTRPPRPGATACPCLTPSESMISPTAWGHNSLESSLPVQRQELVFRQWDILLRPTNRQPRRQIRRPPHSSVELILPTLRQAARTRRHRRAQIILRSRFPMCLHSQRRHGAMSQLEQSSLSHLDCSSSSGPWASSAFIGSAAGGR